MYLFELMNAENASGVSAMRSNFLSEARRQSGISDGQHTFRNPLITMKRCDWLLRCGDQILFIHLFAFGIFATFPNHLPSSEFLSLVLSLWHSQYGYLVQFLVELRQLGHLLHDFLLHEKGRVQGFVALDQQLSQRKLDKGLF